MPERLLAINVREIAAAAAPMRDSLAAGAREARSARELHGQWVDAEDNALSHPFSLGAMQIDQVEGFDGRGGIAWQDEPLDVIVALDPPENAASLRILFAGQVAARVAADNLNLAANRLNPPLRESVGPSSGRFMVQMIAERFEDPDHFRDCVEQARSWALGCSPFDEAAIADNLRYELLFWQTDPIAGQFDTRDTAITDGRLFHGNRALAYELLRPHLNPRFPSVILINSTERGGAGGSGEYSAWASIGSDDWAAVCLHELGHGLGLADEYLDGQRAKQVWAGEPNVSVQSQAGLAPWHSHITVPPESSPSHDLHDQGPDTRQAVGTFAGSRYRSDYYRPMRDCLMRSTVGDHGFCRICADTIRRAILSGFA